MKYDIIGDIHGCYDEFVQLATKLGYSWAGGLLAHPENRMLIFLGDITDRGPASLKMINLVARLVQSQKALYIPGNHCNKLYRYFLGRNVQIKHGLETTVAELEALEPNERAKAASLFKKLYESSKLYLVLDENQLVVAHAGIKARDIGKVNKRIETFVLYGDITGEKDEQGKPVRRDWAKHYTGKTWIVYGHTPVPKPRVVNRTVNIDTGCVFGGALTACQYPEMTYVSVPSSMPFIEEKFTHFDS